jgi:uncharacterized protein YhfF
MYVDKNACDAAWHAYLGQLPTDHPHREKTPDAYGFGGEPALADELAALALEGKKRATTSLPIEYTSSNEPLPRAGDLSIIVRGDGSPVVIIECTRVTSAVFDEIDAEYAATEGEGDGSLEYFREAHIDYFTKVCARLGGSFDGATPVLCQVFRVVWTVPISR